MGGVVVSERQHSEQSEDHTAERQQDEAERAHEAAPLAQSVQQVYEDNPARDRARKPHVLIRAWDIRPFDEAEGQPEPSDVGPHGARGWLEGTTHSRSP